MFRMFLFFFLVLALFDARGQAIKLVTWNLEHMMSERRFAEWRTFCEPFDWDDARASPTRPVTLNYCNALNGLSFPAQRPESLPLHTVDAYAKKVEALRAHAAKLDADIYAFQEVSDADAVKRILPAGYAVFIHSFPISQNLAFAVRENLATKATSRLITDLAQRDDAGHQVRPGLELRLPLFGHDVFLLNLHLKSGCARYVIDAPDVRRAKDAQHLLSITQGCNVLRRQIPPLESWIDDRARAGDVFAVIGDFNRDFSWELMNRVPARLEGSDSLDPKARITGQTRIGSLLKEISDDSPPGSYLVLIRHSPDEPKHRKKNDCHRGIDNFLVSKRFAEAFAVDRASTYATTTVYPPASYGIDRARPSDHCPIALRLQFQ